MESIVRFKISLLSSFLLLTIAASTLNCASPAQFELASLVVTPQEIITGESANVTATIKNTGGSEGTYQANLMVNGSKKETKFILVGPGSTEIVNFSLTGDKPSQSNIQVGESNSTLVVKKKSAKKVFELKYDDDIVDFNNLAYIDGGYLIDFTPPGTPFTITTVKIYGHVLNRDGNDLTEETIEFQVLDKNLKMLYSKKYPLAVFPRDSLPLAHQWKEFTVPDITVQDKFFIHLYSYSKKINEIAKGFPSLNIAPWGFLPAMSISTREMHSAATLMGKDGTITVSEWWSRTSLSRYNWMVRVTGTGTVEE
jgi:hypothetical protein